MKILMIAPTPFFADRGCHVRIYEEARGLIARGHEVKIVTYHLGRDLPGVSTERIPRLPWYRKLAAGPSWHKPYLDMLLLFKSWQVARRFRPDLIHAHLHEGAFVAALLSPLLRRPWLFDCQGSLTGELVDHRFVRPGSLLYRCFYRLEGWINRRADQIVVSATPTADLLRETFGLPAARVTAVVDGVDTGEFGTVTETAELTTRLGLPTGKLLVVFLGVLNSYQGVDLLLDVVALLKPRRDDLHFLIMGFPEATYRQKAEELGVVDNVTFTGRIPYEAAATYLSLGAVAVSPKLSRSEANGKLFNYMACALPCVVFETPVNREILGETGVYARYGDAESFAATLAALLDDPARRAELATQVLAKARTEHAWSRRIELLETCYARLLERK